MKKKIIFFAPNIEDGGIEKNIIILGNYFTSQNKEVEIIHSNISENIKKKLSKKILLTKSNINLNIPFFNKRINNSIKSFIYMLFKLNPKKFDKILSFQDHPFAIIASVVKKKMSINKVIKFFYKEIDFKTWLNVIFNFIFNFSIIISEVLFLSTFFILLNGKTKSEYINVLFQKFEFYFASKIDTTSFTELYLIILIFFLVLKNILILANNFHYNTFIFGLSVKKSSKILTTYINKSYEEFSKKDISIYIKQLVRDVEIVFVGIFGLITNMVP